jgi:hypothetical protein
MAKISKSEALRLAKKSGWKFGKSAPDFFAQNSSSKSADLVAIARLKGYRKPKSASGSTARYFYEYLDKIA